MNKSEQVLYIYTETPLHVGTGTGLGAVDMPIQREKHTRYPIIQASGVKGALRDTAEIAIGRKTDEGQSRILSLFGGASGSDAETHAGAISPSDARILCFPVRALKGVFVWVTSPVVLERYQRETNANIKVDFPELTQNGEPSAIVSSGNVLVNKSVMLEEFAYRAEEHDVAKTWANHLAEKLFPEGGYWQTRLRDHLVILPDDEFRDFVQYSTDIVTRIHLDDETKIVKDGQLFTQELLPADAVLYSVLHLTKSRGGLDLSVTEVADQIKTAIGQSIQIGADETVGRGRVRLAWGALNNGNK